MLHSKTYSEKSSFICYCICVLAKIAKAMFQLISNEENECVFLQPTLTMATIQRLSLVTSKKSDLSFAEPTNAAYHKTPKCNIYKCYPTKKSYCSDINRQEKPHDFDCLTIEVGYDTATSIYKPTGENFVFIPKKLYIPNNKICIWGPQQSQFTMVL